MSEKLTPEQYEDVLRIFEKVFCNFTDHAERLLESGHREQAGVLGVLIGATRSDVHELLQELKQQDN